MQQCHLCCKEMQCCKPTTSLQVKQRDRKPASIPKGNQGDSHLHGHFFWLLSFDLAEKQLDHVVRLLPAHQQSLCLLFKLLPCCNGGRELSWGAIICCVAGCCACSIITTTTTTAAYIAVYSAWCCICCSLRSQLLLLLTCSSGGSLALAFGQSCVCWLLWRLLGGLLSRCWGAPGALRAAC